MQSVDPESVSCQDFRHRRARNVYGSLFLRHAIFCVLRELIFAVRTDWFYLLGINFCDF